MVGDMMYIAELAEQQFKLLLGNSAISLNNNIDDLSYNAANPDFWKAVDPNEFPRHFIDADLYDDISL